MMIAIVIPPRIFSTIMVLSSQAGAGFKIERRDNKGRNANCNKNYV
jgi:hypothetical protein